MELLKEILAKRNDQPDSYVKNLKCETIDEAFYKTFKEYQNDQPSAERVRITALQKLY